MRLPVDLDRFCGSPEENLQTLTDMARQSSAFGPVNFDAVCWADIKMSGLTPSGGRKVVNFWFATLPEGESRRNCNRIPMSGEFVLLAKAILRLSEDAGARSLSAHERLLGAARRLDAYMVDKHHRVCLLDTKDFENTERLAAEPNHSPWTLNHLRQGLADIAAVVNELHLSHERIDYRPQYYCRADELEDDEAQSLPTEAALRAFRFLARSSASLPKPLQVVIWIIALLFLLPWRLGELLNLAFDCERFVESDGAPSSESEWKKRTADVCYGLQYFDSKSQKVRIKWVPSCAAPSVREIVARIRCITADARASAEFVERCGRPRLPEPIRTQDRLSVDQVACLLRTRPKDAYEWLRRKGIEIVETHVKSVELVAGLERVKYKSQRERNQRILAWAKRRPASDIPLAQLSKIFQGDELRPWLARRKVAVNKSEVLRDEFERALLECHCALRPDFPLRLHELLFVFPYRFFDAKRAPIECIAAPLTTLQIRRFLTGKKGDIPSIFGRFGKDEPDGSPIYLTSTMLRRHVTTLARQYGLPAAQASRWLGHANDASLAHYDRRNAEEKAEIPALLAKGLAEKGRLRRASR